MTTVLSVRDLRVWFAANGTAASTPLRGVDLDVTEGETLGVVGETGCGKTLTGLSVLRLLPPTARISGRIELDGTDIVSLPEPQVARLRGRAISMIFQNPGTAFNPVFTVGWQMQQIVRQHLGLSRGEARDHVAAHLRMVGMPDVERVLDTYPHQLSGGMLQRAMIAAALLCDPRSIIADEPTTALDATIAEQILALLRRLQAERGFALMLITHNLHAVRKVCDRVAVLYAGRVVEVGATETLLATPRHPYTRGLIAAMPTGRSRSQRLATIPGSVPANLTSVRGCAFAPRCSQQVPACWDQDPRLVPVSPGHHLACPVEGGA